VRAGDLVKGDPNELPFHPQASRTST
jgi:hypothetical protein